MPVRQSLMLSWVNVRGIRLRALSSAVAMLGFAGVAAMLVVMLSGRQALRAMYELAGRDDVAIVSMGDTPQEAASFIVPPVVLEIERMPGIAHTESGPAISKEFVRPGGVRLLTTSSRVGVAVIGRGVTPRAFELRPRLRVIEGRLFDSGKYEVIVGRALAEQFGVRVGSQVRVQNATLEVVGLFDSAGTTAGLEVWADKAVFESLFSPGATPPGAPAFEQNSVLWVKLTGVQGLKELNAALAASPSEPIKTFNIRARSEREFLRAQSNDLIRRATQAVIAVGLVMGIGALFGAINTMYAAVAHRSREIATLRALGFDSLPVAVSVISEALLLSVGGGLLGVALALLVTYDLSFTLYNPGTFMNLALEFLPTPGTALIAFGYLLLLGIASSILPCIRALRCPIPVGLFAR